MIAIWTHISYGIGKHSITQAPASPQNDLSKSSCQPLDEFLSPAGATFVHDVEVTFHPGEERVHITQTAEGLDPENYLSIKTNIEGQVPFIPGNFTAHNTPYKEFYHHRNSGMCEFPQL